MDGFVEWLEARIKGRTWSYSEFARQAELSHASVSQVMSGKQKPGLQFCFGAAKALDEPPETVLREAGYLPIKPQRDQVAEEIMHFYDRMTPEGREYFRRIARVLGER